MLDGHKTRSDWYTAFAMRTFGSYHAQKIKEIHVSLTWETFLNSIDSFCPIYPCAGCYIVRTCNEKTRSGYETQFTSVAKARKYYRKQIKTFGGSVKNPKITYVGHPEQLLPIKERN